MRRLYGPRSERVDPSQLLLFVDQAGGEPGAVPAFESPAELSAASPTGRAKGHGRKPLPADLPRERRVHGIPPEQRACPECGEDRSPIGEEVSEELDYRPAALFVKEQARYLHCQQLLTPRRRASRGMKIRIAALSEAHSRTRSRFERAPA